ncbi:hypothetical protein [Chryseobacterium herbae]|uniref:Uncharacterized protein n=1 Tax=Chryseobacterium herbae TaxID=2976476 RepID=A0ABT2IYY9_9FLAO|nr:hypothetical protein [Chryseobacterium sp. pc1-10]MCT2564063.1 hypothetical protein [Chryseobacterium sp. pc1-10]
MELLIIWWAAIPCKKTKYLNVKFFLFIGWKAVSCFDKKSGATKTPDQKNIG